ncbi:MAG TPA: hypothetical protein VMZ03_07605 [Chitinophagaceae bacterium]|nr:hypothetical protein [Chitinophagaceae bacterium]
MDLNPHILSKLSLEDLLSLRTEYLFKLMDIDAWERRYKSTKAEIALINTFIRGHLGLSA